MLLIHNCHRTRQPLDSAKFRFDGGVATLAEALANHVRGKGVNLVLDCVVNRVSTADSDAVVVEGVQVRQSHDLVVEIHSF